MKYARGPRPRVPCQKPMIVKDNVQNSNGNHNPLYYIASIMNDFAEIYTCINTDGKRDLDFGEGSCVRGIFKERV